MQLKQNATLQPQLAAHLMLLPSMQQALQVLQLPLLELAPSLREVLMGNPMWEVEEPDLTPWLSRPSRAMVAEDPEIRMEEDPRDRLRKQLFDLQLLPIEKDVALWLVDDLDSRGILTSSLEEISSHFQLPLEQLQHLLTRLQSLEPAGVFAPSHRENLLIQLRRMGREQSVGYRLLLSSGEDLVHLRLKEVCRKSGLPEDQILEQLRKDFSGLQLSAWLEVPVNGQVLADATVHLEGGQWRIEIHDEYWPRLVPQPDYLQAWKLGKVDSSSMQYLGHQYKTGAFLARALQQRGLTLRRILEEIIPHQEAYLSTPTGSPQTLTMTAVAQRLNLSESTLSRAVHNKWIGAPRGLIAMRSLFVAQGVHGDCVGLDPLQELQRLITEEPPDQPLSDEALAQRLQALGFQIARRTVAKYRASLGIPPQRERRWRQR